MNEERLKELEKRVTQLENTVFSKKFEKPISALEKTNYAGLAGGIRLLIDNEFFKSLRSLSEIVSELKKHEYHYSSKSISKLIIDSVTKKKTLNRVKEGSIWKYVVRK